MKNGNVFMRSEEFLPAFEKIKKIIDSEQATDLESYSKFLEFNDKKYPLLLLHGETLSLPREPLNIHLLPPLKNTPDRWLIAYYAERTDTKSFVQLFNWRYSEQHASIKPLKNQDPVKIGDNAVLPRQSAKSVTCKEMGAIFIIQLNFSTGELTIVADPEKGIVSKPTWIAQDNTSLFRTERFSWGEMDAAVLIKTAEVARKNTQEKNWNDQIKTIDAGKKIVLSPKEGFGHINGADALSQFPQHVYLASSNAKVYRINTDGTESTPISSDFLTGSALDVLGINNNDKTVLTAVYNGSFYLLQDTGTELKKINWQYTGLQIRALIGFGESYLLALDQSGTLFPLMLFDPREYDVTKKKIINCIYQRNIANPPDWANNFDKANHYLKLLLEHNFYDQNDKHYFFEYFDQLLDLYQRKESDQLFELALCHKALLIQLFRFLRGICFDSVPGKQESEIYTATKALIKLVDLPEQTPDFLWFWLGRNSDWISFWKNNSKVKAFLNKPENIDLKEQLNKHLKQFYSEQNNHREKTRLKLNTITPLLFTDSIRLPSQAHHLRSLDEKSRLFVFLEYCKGLIIAKIDQNNKICILAELRFEDADWNGIPSTLIVVPVKKGQINSLIIVGTNQGELSSYLYDTDQQKISPRLWRLSVPLSLLCSQYLEEFHVLLISGQNINNKASIHWLDLNQHNSNSRSLWVSEKLGSIRMMALSSNHSLWAINQEQGELLHIPFNPHFFSVLARKGKRQLSHKVWAKTQQTLHAMAYSKQEKMIVCGGGEGILLAFDSKTGALLWRINCSGNIRRIRYLPEYKNNRGIWMICGDDSNLYMIDHQGKLQGLEEKYGPVSSLWILNNKNEILLSTQNGRILFGKTTQAELSEETFWTQPLDKLYPFQQDNSKIEPTELSKYSLVINEPVIALAIIKHFQRQLEIIKGKSLINAIEELLIKEKKYHLMAYFLQNCCEQIESQSTTYYVNLYHIAEKVWEQIKQDVESETECKILSPLIAILIYITSHTHAGILDENQQNNRQASVKLLQEIQNCIWGSKNSKEKLALSWCTDALISLRLIQALSYWRLVDENFSPDKRIEYWCKKMADLWQLDKLTVMREYFAQLFLDGLKLTGIYATKYEQWLHHLATENYEKANEISPLSALEKLSNLDESMVQFSNFKQVFAENKGWIDWLDNLQNQLQLLNQKKQQVSYCAWQELSALKALKVQIDMAEYSFSLSEDPLLMLWLPSFQKFWQPYLKQYEEKVYQCAKDKFDKYLTVTWSVHWNNAEHAQLNLKFSNNHPVAVIISAISWNNKEQIANKLPITIEASEKIEQCGLALKATSSEKLVGELVLSCNYQERNFSFKIEEKVEEERNLKNFTSEPKWQATWMRLSDLLSAKKEKLSFSWINGNHWSKAERQRLIKLVYDNYGIKVLEEVLPPFEVNSFQKDKALFSPDLALNAEPLELLLQLHDLLYAFPNSENHSLALWCAFRDIPKSIRKVLKDEIANVATCRSFLQALLLKNCVNNIITALVSLPNYALGTWCSGGAIFPTQEMNNSQVNQEQLYLPNACLLPGKILEIFDKADVDVKDIAEFLSISEDLATEQRQARKLLSTTWSYWQNPKRTTNSIDTFAQLFLERFCNESIRVQKTIGWHGDCSELQLLHQEYTHCYLVPKTDSNQRRQLMKESGGLWFCLGERAAPTELPDTALALSRSDCSAILHIDKNYLPHALRLLNRIAVKQDPEAVKNNSPFRSRGGLGHLVAKHFAGRETELKQLKQLLHAVDNGEGNSSALFIGGRRMGKTSLREKILYDIRRDEPARVCLFLDCQMYKDKNYVGPHLEFMFHQKFRKLIEEEEGFSIASSWFIRDKDNKNACDKSREELKEQLQTIKNKTGLVPLLIIDETDLLANADANNPNHSFELFNFIRALINGGVLSCFATCYPHGAENKSALNIATHDPQSPLHNTFVEEITLDAWSADTAWSFLENKLAGLGVIISQSFRQDLLGISRSIPWIVQDFGMQICKNLPTNTSIINFDVWRATKQQVLEDIKVELKVSVNNIADRLDEQYELLSSHRQLQCIGGGRLWDALINTAPALAECNGEASFRVEDIKRYLPDVKERMLREALNGLSSSLLLKGEKTDKDLFYFANNLLPAYCYYRDIE